MNWANTSIDWNSKGTRFQVLGPLIEKAFCPKLMVHLGMDTALVTYNARTKCDMLNNYFQSVFSRDDAAMDTSDAI